MFSHLATDILAVTPSIPLYVLFDFVHASQGEIKDKLKIIFY